MNTYIKPPIGVAPHWYVYNKRMRELASAIERYLSHIVDHNATVNVREYYDQIADWSVEIAWIARLESELEDRP